MKAMFTIFVAFLFVGAFAMSPVRNSQPYNEELSKRAMYFSSVAYCPQAMIADWSCGSPCDQNPGFKVDKLLHSEAFDSLNSAYLGYDATESQYVVTFEGTATSP
jgi:hypothetical protein